LKAPPAAPALLAALLACGCASSPWRSTESVPGGKLYVPKLYAPLRPGSIYPDKNAPIPARARPAMVLVCPSKGDCREKDILDQAAQRGIVVLKTRTAETAIAPRPEVDPTRTGTLVVARASLKVEVPLPATATPQPSSPSKQIFLAAVLDKEPPEARDATVLKLYSPDKKGLLPAEAFRDAVEWLAGELAIH
jgi:hypothetical protein